MKDFDSGYENRIQAFPLPIYHGRVLQLGDLAWGYYPSRDAAEMTVSFKPELGSNSWLLQ